MVFLTIDGTTLELAGDKNVGEVSELIRNNQVISEMGQAITLCVILTLVVASASLTAATAGSVMERKRAFTLLRASGLPVSSLYKTILLEAALPPVLSNSIGVLVGTLSSAAFVSAIDATYSFPVEPTVVMAVSSATAGLLMVMLTFPLLSIATRPRSLRTE